MSLLLEALKRAEKAKEEAQRRAEDSAPAAENRRVLTRDNLPDISQPLEILSDDIGQAETRPEPEPRPAPRAATKTGAPPRAERPKASAAGAAQSERAAAKRVFEAKLREPNPRLPFFITLGVLGVCAVGIVVYFWYQLRPPPALVMTHPSRPAAEAPVARAETAAPPTAPAEPMRPIRGMPTGVSAPAAAAAAIPQPKQTQASASAEPRAAAPRPRRSAAARRTPSAESAPVVAAQGSTVIASRAAPEAGIHPQVEAGYAAYQAGDLAGAGEAYRKALADEPTNRDALLGLAGVETRLGNSAAAEALYARVLQRDPRDVHARAGMLALRGERQDPVVAESQLKNLLAVEPQASELQYALGNQLARQARWADAQQAYFKAFSAEPDNADYAYNLAVALDHLHKPALALEYYRRAVGLAGQRTTGFDRSSVERRVQELAR